MHKLLEAYHVANELVDGICMKEFGWDFAVLLDSSMLYYQTIEILEKHISTKIYVKPIFKWDAVKIFENSKNKLFFIDRGEYLDFQMHYDTIEDMIEHLLLIPSELKKWEQEYIKIRNGE